MSVFNVKVKSSSSSDKPPQGTHKAVLVALIDLGTHEETYPGQKPKQTHKVFLAWELVEEKLAGMDRNHVIGKQYTLSGGTKSKLREMYSSWRGKALAEGEEMQLEKLVGKSCLVVLEDEIKGDKTYSKLTAVTGLPKGTPPAKASFDPVVWFIGCGEPVPEHTWLPYSFGEQLKDIIARSAEMTGKTGESEPAAAAVSNSEPEPF